MKSLYDLLLEAGDESGKKFFLTVKRLGIQRSIFVGMPLLVPAGKKLGKFILKNPKVFHVVDFDSSSVVLRPLSNYFLDFQPSPDNDNEYVDDSELEPIEDIVLTYDQFQKLSQGEYMGADPNAGGGGGGLF